MMMNHCSAELTFSAEDSTDFTECWLELVTDWAVDEKVWREVEHDEEVSHWLQTHDPQWRNIMVSVPDTLNLHIWKQMVYWQCTLKQSRKYFGLPTSATTRTPRKTRRALQRMCMKTMETRVTAKLNSDCLCLLRRPLRICIKIGLEKLRESNITISGQLG